ncbi:MAG: hypothetical protein WC455_04115 [Dehalococcoidia bacterium]|jgi:hypothetical protein
MKKFVPVLSLLMGVVLLVIALVLPSGSGGGDFIRMAKMLPKDIGEFTFFDVSMLQADEDLLSAWNTIKEDLIGEDIYSENISKVTGFGMAGSEYDLMMYSGDFDLEQMTSAIEQSSIESFEHEGITIWTDQYSYSTAVIDDIVFIGSSEDIQLCINVSNGKGASLYEDKDAKDVINRLPGGYMLGVMIVEDESSTETYGILAVSMAESKQGGNISQMSILKFVNASKTQEYVTMIEEEELTEGYDIIQDGQYLTISSMSEIPGPEETAYNSMYADLENAVVAYYYDHDGVFPTINGTVNISGYDVQILDICALRVSAEGGFNKGPDGVAAVTGSDNDNCDAGCEGCLSSNHYIWAIDDYGIYSTCVGADCDANGEEGFQGVWP